MWQSFFIIFLLVCLFHYNIAFRSSFKSPSFSPAKVIANRNLIGQNLILKLKRDDEEKIFTDSKDSNSLIFGKEDEVTDSRRQGLDIRRFLLFNGLALAIALGGNFLGITSTIMSTTSPDFFRAAKIDQIYPIGGYKRYVDSSDQFEFKFPETWLPDQSIILARARNQELPQSLRERKSERMGPSVAYGPPGGNGKENLSVIKSQVMPGFSLQGTLGEPRDAAIFLLSNIIAPESSGKTYEIINTFENIRNGNPSYTFEYTIRKGENFYQHSISVIMSRGTELYTMTVVSPENKWSTVSNTIKEVANSFQFTSSVVPAYFY
eukprot:gene13231-27995_t